MQNGEWRMEGVTEEAMVHKRRSVEEGRGAWDGEAGGKSGCYWEWSVRREERDKWDGLTEVGEEWGRYK